MNPNGLGNKANLENKGRCVALIGSFSSGKTSLLEAILYRCGEIDRLGSVAAGTSFGDASPEARAHVMSVEPNIVTVPFLDNTFTFIDCPGSIEFLQDMRAVLPICDAAVVVCEPDERKLLSLHLILREVAELKVPHMLFINKIDGAVQGVRETLKNLQKVSSLPLLLRQIPIWKDGIATGFIDLALERSFIYREGVASERIDTPVEEISRHKDARFQMLEKLADYDDQLMEQLLSEIEPERDAVLKDLVQEFRQCQVVPAFIGSAQKGFGITRLLKALRHEAPFFENTQKRFGIEQEGESLAQALRTSYAYQGGKMTFARIMRGSFKEGDSILGSKGGEARLSSLNILSTKGFIRKNKAIAGEVVGFAKLDAIETGETFTVEKKAPLPLIDLSYPQPTYSFSLKVKDRKDDVRLSSGLNKIIEEDPSLFLDANAELGDIRLSGQGEMHLRVALEKLATRYQVRVDTRKPKIGYKETIRKESTARGRHKKQSGGHGQFGDVVIKIRPLERGRGVSFQEEITGGAVPKNYIPSVETGIRDYVKKGPLGFPVIDIGVTLADGSYHPVDSSDAAFQMAGRIAMNEAVSTAQPVLLEPVLKVDISVPNDSTSKATALVSERRGQTLGFERKEGWEGWDVIHAQIPESEIGDLIVKLRSVTSGVGFFHSTFLHMEETPDKITEQIMLEMQKP